METAPRLGRWTRQPRQQSRRGALEDLSIPSFRSSPWMRGAPRCGFAPAMSARSRATARSSGSDPRGCVPSAEPTADAARCKGGSDAVRDARTRAFEEVLHRPDDAEQWGTRPAA